MRLLYSIITLIIPYAAKADYGGNALPVPFFAGANLANKGFDYRDAILDPLDSQRGYWCCNTELGLKFSHARWSVVVFGKSLSKGLVRNRSCDIPLKAGSHWAQSTAPRACAALLQVKI